MVKKIQRGAALIVLAACGCVATRVPESAGLVDDFIVRIASARASQRVSDFVTWLGSHDREVTFVDVIDGPDGGTGYWTDGRCSINFDSYDAVASILGAHCILDTKRDAIVLFERWRSQLTSAAPVRARHVRSGRPHADLIRNIIFAKPTPDWAYDVDLRVIRVDDQFEVHVRFARDLPLLSTHD